MTVTSAVQSLSPAIMPLWELMKMMIREMIPALPTFSDGIRTDHGLSIQSFLLRIVLRKTISAAQLQFPAIMSSRGLAGMMTREQIPVPLTFSKPLFRAVPSL